MADVDPECMPENVISFTGFNTPVEVENTGSQVSYDQPNSIEVERENRVSSGSSREEMVKSKFLNIGSQTEHVRHKHKRIQIRLCKAERLTEFVDSLRVKKMFLFYGIKVGTCDGSIQVSQPSVRKLDILWK